MRKRWARVPGIVIASGRIRADTEKHTASAAFAFVGRCRRLADIRPLAGLFRPAGALLQRPPDSFRGGGCENAKTPSEGGRISNRREILHRLCPCAERAVCRDQRGLWRNSWPPAASGYQGFKFDADMADAENQKDLPDL